MEVFGTIVVGEWVVISALVSLGVSFVDSGEAVEWLMDVSDIVDQESQGIGLGLFLVILQEFHHGGVDEVLLVVVLLIEPVNDVGDND